MSHLLAIDGINNIRRLFSPLPADVQQDATAVSNAVVKGIHSLIHRSHPSHVGIILEGGIPTWRHTSHPGYKADRKPAPSEFLLALPVCIRALKDAGLCCFSISNVEADDVIGTLAMKASSHGISTLIASTDKDFNQLLVNPALQLYHPIKKEYRDANWVKDTFGINADQFVDWLALVGDSSDGIPGITDVGPDTASKWLQKYHNIDTLLVRANEIKGKRGENLRSEMTRLRLMRRIATIHTSLELGVTLRNFRLPDGFY